MTTLSRRLKQLETSYGRATGLAAERARNLEESISREALHRLSDDELRRLRTAVLCIQQHGELTAQDQAAIEVYGAAVEEECRRTGFDSFADFYRHLRAD